MDWDPISNFEKILLQQIEEMERLEFADESQPNNGNGDSAIDKLANNIDLEERKEEESPDNVQNDT